MTVERWSLDAIRERGRKLAQVAITIWGDVGRASISTQTEKQSSIPPVGIRFRGKEQSVASWKDAFTKLLKEFDRCAPGLLQGIAAEQTLPAVVSENKDRFPRSKVQIGAVYVNTHASAATLREWCRKIAKIGAIAPDDFEFVQPDRATFSA